MITLEKKDHSFSVEEREDYLRMVLRQDTTQKVVLKTCNRVEIYSGAGKVKKNIVKHLFRVVCGIESRMLGEGAIQGQVKGAYRHACKTTLLSSEMHRLFQSALAVGKKVRKMTEISRGAMSHSQAAVELLLKKNICLKNLRITVVGAHNLNENILFHLVKNGAQTILLANRTLNKAKKLAKKFGCQSLTLNSLPEKLKNTDVLICATSAPHPIIMYDIFPKGKKMFIIDMAVPRDVDVAIGKLPDVTLYNIENVENVIQQNIIKREEEVKKANCIIEQEIQQYFKRQKALKVTNKIKIVCRDSELSLKQVEEVLGSLPFDVTANVFAIKSFGDKHKSISLIDNKIADIFTREVDEQILNKKADIAIHSAKDLPYPLPKGLNVIALLRTGRKTDALVSRDKLHLNKLPKGALVGTSSVMRQRQVLAARPDIKVIGIRGSVEERLALVDSNKIDALLVASCALDRLGFANRITQELNFNTHTLQGDLAVVALRQRDDLINIFHDVDDRRKDGKVYLVGGGPGDKELLTLKADRVLVKADVVMYDALVSKDILYGYKYKALKIDVGKRKGQHALTQVETKELIYKYVLAGKNVVRLKGGDPFVFGRGGEEMDYLQERLIGVEIVPGITAAEGASAYAGIPLTYREKSSSVAFCTGYPLDNITVPKCETLVYYMSATSRRDIVKAILKTGRKRNTPLAVISHATLPNQIVRRSTLAKELRRKEVDAMPAIMIVGAVVGENETDCWYTKKPKILFIGTNPEKYRRLGEIIHWPVIRIKPLEKSKHVDNCIRNISKYDWVIFTSRYTIKYFIERLMNIKKDIRMLGKCKIASIGTRTTQSLKEYGLIPDLQAMEESSKGLISLFNKKCIKGKKICIPRSEIGLRVLPDGLRKSGNKIDTVIMYKNIEVRHADKPDLPKMDGIVFTAPSTVKNFKKIYTSLPKHIVAYAVGDITRKTLEKEYPYAEVQTLSKG